MGVLFLLCLVAVAAGASSLSLLESKGRSHDQDWKMHVLEEANALSSSNMRFTT